MVVGEGGGAHEGENCKMCVWVMHIYFGLKNYQFPEQFCLLTHGAFKSYGRD